MLLGWLAGWTASGRRGVLVSYEAFAPLLLTGLVGYLKQRRLFDPTLPSINVLLTSYGWHNSYTHGDPSLITALLVYLSLHWLLVRPMRRIIGSMAEFSEDPEDALR